MSNLRTKISDLYQSSVSGLSYRLLEPIPGKMKGCLVLLHGVGSNEKDLASLVDGLDPEILVVLPRGPLTLGANQFAWFQVAFTPSGPVIVAEEAERSRQTLIRLVAEIQRTHQILPGRTVIAGFSQGGIMSASVALSEPESLTGFGLLSGRILPELEPRIAARERLAALGGFVAHGEFDSKLPVTWAHRADSLLEDLGVKHQFRLYPVDHQISLDMQSDFVRWVNARM